MKNKINSFKSGDHLISVYDDGSLSCDCKSWIYHKSPKTCKHIQEHLNNQIKQVEIIKTELNKEKLIDDYLSDEYDRKKDEELDKEIDQRLREIANHDGNDWEYSNY